MSTSLGTLSSLLARPGVRSFARPHRVAATCAMVEPLEDRQFFSAAPLLHAPAAAAAKAPPALNVDKAAKHADKIADKIEKNVDKFADKLAKHPDKVLGNGVTSLIPLKIDAIKLVNGTLTAVGSLAGQPFSLPITLGTSENPDQDSDCAVLHVELGPIHLNLLGLHVDTSPICLDVIGGDDTVLGGLICDVADLLNGGTIGGILGGLGAQANTLLGGLTDLLNGVLGRILSPTSVTGNPGGGGGGGGAGATDILNLSVGPIDLDLLGLDLVHLDNCDDGPVTVDVTAGPGGLLGGLLGGIGGLLDNPTNPGALGALLGRISGLLGRLL
jgi:hypothetical protein